jgi:serine/threonine-protein kinase HipA
VNAFLQVYWEGRKVGRIEPGDPYMRFTYDSEYIAANGAAISASLPLRESCSPEKAHSFFANMLPEGQLRETLSRGLRVSADNDYALLAELGRECAGALQILPGDSLLVAGAGDYLALDPLQLHAQFEQQLTGFAARGDHAHVARFSLAGVQGKLPVAIFGDDLFLSQGAATTHILKPGQAQYPDLPQNEYAAMYLAQLCGVPAADVDLLPYSLYRDGLTEPCLQVRRYDRIVEGPQQVRRLHQEDFCQALGISRLRKYEDEGGPSFAEMYRGLLELSSVPVWDQRVFMKTAAFNVIIGNVDAHAKNFSLLYYDGQRRLAPLYDLVPVVLYPQLREASFAQKLGGAAHLEDMSRHTLAQLARDCGVGLRIVIDTFRTMAKNVLGIDTEFERILMDKLGRDYKALDAFRNACRSRANKLLEITS